MRSGSSSCGSSISLSLAEIEEAALMDGAGYFRIYWSIILPMSRPILSALAISSFSATGTLSSGR